MKQCNYLIIGTFHVFLLIYNFETIDMVFLSMWFTNVIL